MIAVVMVGAPDPFETKPFGCVRNYLRQVVALSSSFLVT
jgi:hypothetical protein